MRKLPLLLIAVMPLMASCKETNNVSREAYDTMYNHLVEMWSKSLDGVHYDTVFYGDSRIAGGDFANRYKNENAVNLGVGGDRVQNLIDRFKLVEAVTPKYLFISIGGNDALSDSFDENVFKTTFDSLITKVKTLDTTVVLNTNPAIRYTDSISVERAKNANSNISKTNEYIKKVAEDNNYYLIDIASKLNDEEGMLNANYTPEGIHYNSKGYEIWFAEIDKAFTNIKK